MEEKKEYEEPSVTKVEFEFNEAITASGCISQNDDYGNGLCYD